MSPSRQHLQQNQETEFLVTRFWEVQSLVISASFQLSCPSELSQCWSLTQPRAHPVSCCAALPVLCPAQITQAPSKLSTSPPTEALLQKQYEMLRWSRKATHPSSLNTATFRSNAKLACFVLLLHTAWSQSFSFPSKSHSKNPNVIGNLPEAAG